MNEKIIGVEVSGEVYPIKDEETSGKIQTLGIKVQELNTLVETHEEEIEKLKDSITVKRHTDSRYSSTTSNYTILGETSKKRVILNAFYDFDANVVVQAYFVNNNQLRWRIIEGGVNEGHNVIIDYGEISN